MLSCVRGPAGMGAATRAPGLQALTHNAQAHTDAGWIRMHGTHTSTHLALDAARLGARSMAAYLQRQPADLADAQDSSPGVRNAVDLSREGDNASVIPFQQMGAAGRQGR
jgi:hypothetical protein